MERTARERTAAEAAAQPAGRSAPELAVLLLELASVVKARSVFGPGDAKLAAVFDRCLRAWRTDLARHGALQLELTPAGFREVGGGGHLQHARLGELLRDLAGRGLTRLRFDPELDGDALAGFVHLLADPLHRELKGAAFVARLTALAPIGIGADTPPPMALAAPAPAPVVAAPALAPVAAPAQPEALAPLLVAVPVAPDDDTEVELISVADDPEPKAVPPVQMAPESEFEAESDGSDPDSDTMPIGHPAHAAPLDTLLAELSGCGNASSYLDLARRAITEAERARDANEVHRVLDALAQHIETKEQRLGEIARSFLVSLCQGNALRDLLERAARGVGGEQVRAAQILALVGEPAAAAVLERMPAYPEMVQRERLVPLVLALGDRAVPELMLRLDRPEREVARSAAHILGMMQHPGAVERLADLAVGPDAVLREEAARALVRIGTEDAVNGLTRGLRAERDIVTSAVQHLGGTASARAVTPLGHALERALEAKDVELAKEILRALGRVGRPEANVIFGSVMRRKAGLTGRWLKDVKVAAASALATVPGDQAVALLAEALQSRDEPLRKAAQRALDRRAEAVARGSRVAR